MPNLIMTGSRNIMVSIRWGGISGMGTSVGNFNSVGEIKVNIGIIRVIVVIFRL